VIQKVINSLADTILELKKHGACRMEIVYGYLTDPEETGSHQSQKREIILPANTVI
jgi:hypothetical protein